MLLKLMLIVTGCYFLCNLGSKKKKEYKERKAMSYDKIYMFPEHRSIQ